MIGPSGTGKSTLLRCINLLEMPTAGRIFVDDIDITDPKCDVYKVRQKMGMVFQSFNLFGHMRVIENIMYGPVKLLGVSRQQAYDEGMRLLSKVGLSEKAMNYPEVLSGGQKQRVAIMRTLAMNPDIILMDEPTSALDPTMVGEVQAVIKDLAKTGKTMMIVTHEMNFARSICNRMFFMDEGGIYEDGPPEQIFDNPQREKTRRFVRKLKVLELEIKHNRHDFLGMQSQIAMFCAKNQISKKIENRLNLIFEETVQQMLIPVMNEPDIMVTMEYSEENENANVSILYGGDKLNIMEMKDNLSMKVLKGVEKQIQYEWNPEEKRGNRISMIVC